MKITKCFFCTVFMLSVLLVSHTTLAQGHYTGTYSFVHDDCSGLMTISKTKTANVYLVEMSATMKNPPYNTGEFTGHGVVAGGNMVVEDKKYFPGAIVYIAFKGNQSVVTTSDAFKRAGLAGAGVVFGGTWIRK